MCLCEVEPGPPKPQAACTLTAQDGMVVRTALTSAGRRGGAERDARVHPRQPPARLPGLRQGRRVPAAGPDVPLRARQHAHDVPEADVRQADPDLAADRARPRALHPLLPLHALLRGRRRGRPARRRQPRRAVDDRDVRGRAVPRAVQRQRDRALPGRRADVDDVPLRGAAVGDPGRADRLRHVPRRLQRPRDDARGEGEADPSPQPPRGRPGLALRQGPLRVCAPRRARPVARPAAARAAPRARGGLVGARARRGRAAAARGRRPDRHRAVRLGDGRAGVRARRSCCGRGSARTPPFCPKRSRTRSTPSACRSRRSRDADVDRRRSATRRVVERAPIVELWIKEARRNGARVLYELDEEAIRSANSADPDLVRSRRRRRRDASRRSRSGSARAAPSTCPRRRTAAASADAWARRRRTRSRRAPSRSGCSSSPATRPRRTQPCARSRSRRSACSSISMFHGLAAGWADLVLPGTSYLERDGTYVNLEGRAAAAAPHRDPARARRARLDLEARGALRASSSRRIPRPCSRRCRRSRSAGFRSARSASARRCRPRPRPPSTSRRLPSRSHATAGAAPRPLPAALLRAGGRPRPASCSSSGRCAEVELSRAGRARARDPERRRGDRPLERHLGRRCAHA